MFIASEPFPLRLQQVDGREMLAFDRDPRTLRDVFAASTRSPEDIVIRYQDEVVTGRQRWLAVCGLARAMSESGVGPGDRVAIAMRNYPEWIITFWATQVLGAVTVAFNAWYAGPELADLVEDSTPVMVVADQERAEKLVATGRVADVEILVARRSHPIAGTSDLQEFIDSVPETDGLPEVAIGADSPATILFTSGTTSRPKGVQSTHRNHLTNLFQLRQRSRETGPAAPILLSYPLFHIAGLTLAYSSAFTDATAILMYKWDAAMAWQQISEHGVTSFSGPPLVVTELIEIISENETGCGSLRSMGFGGSLAPANSVRAIGDLGAVAPVTGYGLTESTGTLTAIAGDDFLQRPDSIGRPLPTVRVKVVDDCGYEVLQGEPGELLVRGPQLVGEYLNRPAETGEAFIDGWFRTGDMVRQDDEGFLFLVGRVKDVVIRGGENVSAGEVEGALNAHPDVAEAAVIGSPHPRLGEEVCAIVRLRAGMTASGEDIASFLAQRLASFKVPSIIRIVSDPLPRNAAGKLDKAPLRAAAEVVR